ncbi:transporter substrate-binding domain-containing protein [Corynebacterium aquatimens]|uniref:transporter substrate-binding domain-containing protein n=1 Tax=Corynebacterium TaxID=1716 RepID=UPI001F35F0BB|nr:MULTISPECIES: transporter substrate-binding domain-containing protein [Corynebacterium]QYH19198.1 transporter substrate-binding domain-containing protein [Corynebacterium aquatimens]UIZ91914.1 transporter substrate-binding domain-containing protein [Corynebacterium sp. CNCTC7651]
MSVTRNRLAAGLAALVAAATLTACGGTETAGTSATTAGGDTAASAGYRSVEDIQNDGTVKIGVFSDKAPFGYVDANGKYAGYDIEYGNRLGEDLGVNVEYVPVEAASRVEFLDTNKVDIILANFTLTPERQEKVDFANPYMKVSLGAVTPDKAPLNSVEELEGKNVIVVKGTTAETFLEKNHPEIKLTKFEQYTEATNALIDGRGDAWVTDNTEALAWAAKTDGFTATIPTLGETDTIAGAVAKGNTDLRDWMNNELEDLGKENFFHQAYDKTLKPVYGDAVSADDLVVEGGKL